MRFVYLRSVWNMCRNLNIWDVFWKNQVESGRRVAGAIRFLVNVRGLQLECARVLHETLLVPFLIYGSETMILR